MSVYTPKSQIIKNLYSNREFEKVISGEQYTGYYHKTADGRAFTGRDPDDVPVTLLRPIIPNNTDEGSDLRANEQRIVTQQNIRPNKGNYRWLSDVGPFEANQANDSIVLLDERRAPVASPRLPESREYERGYMDRYFVYNLKNFQYFETTEQDYTSMIYNPGKIDALTFRAFKIKWFISAVSRKVVRQKNLGYLNYLKQTQNMPGVINYFKNSLDQYYKRKTQDLFTPGGELLKNGVNYVGSYHVHPTVGPMEGARHTTTSHSVLTFIDDPFTEENDTLTARPGKLAYKNGQPYEGLYHINEQYHAISGLPRVNDPNAKELLFCIFNSRNTGTKLYSITDPSSPAGINRIEPDKTLEIISTNLQDASNSQFRLEYQSDTQPRSNINTGGGSSAGGSSGGGGGY